MTSLVRGSVVLRSRGVKHGAVAGMTLDSSLATTPANSVTASAATAAASPPAPRSDPLAAADAARHELRVLPWLAAAITLIAAIVAIEPLPVGVFYDDAQYVILAKALATGHGYRFLNLPGAPAATHFPPGYPAFLALLWRLSPSFPENVAVFKFANAVLLAAVAALTFGFARRRLQLPAWAAFIAALAGAATIPTLVLSSAIMSEPLFLALLLPLLVWAERAVDQRHDGRSALLLGAAIGLLALVRTHGIALGAAAVLALLVRRRRRDALLAAAAMVAVLTPWALWVQVHDAALPPLVRGAYGSYIGWLVTGFRVRGMELMAVTIPDNVATFWMTIARSLAPSGSRVIAGGIGAIYLALTGVGARACWRRAPVTMLFLGCYLAMVVCWPFSPLRFYWGIWPLLMLLPAAGTVALLHSASVRHGRLLRPVAGVAAFALCAGILLFNVRGFANSWWSSNARFHARRVLPQLAWVDRFAGANDVIGSDAEGAVYLYTGRPAVPMTTFTAAEYVGERSAAEESGVVANLVDRYRPRFLLATSPKLAGAIAAVARTGRSGLVRIDTIPGGVVYERR